MSSSILGVGQSALAAAQAGLVTTGHNIANASTPGYSRQIVVQGSAGSQDMGFGFVGKGTTVVDIMRIYNDLTAEQVRSAESATNEYQIYHTQISRINNQLADTTAGLSPALQDFFKGVQDMASNPSAPASRQAALSTAESLAARFQSLDGQIREVSESVNAQIHSSVSAINIYADQIAKLNDAIEKAQGNAEGRASNDLLDQRDLAVNELAKEIKTTVIKQGNSYNVFIGSGQPLVVGAKAFDMVPLASPTDPTRAAVGYVSKDGVVALSESSLSGGKLGGLLNFRSTSLDAAQNALGRVALGLATTFNAQHRLGMEFSQGPNGAMGGDFFNAAAPRVEPSGLNTGSPASSLQAQITDVSKLTTNDYRITYDGSQYWVSNLSEGAPPTAFASFPTGDGQAIPGIQLSEGTPPASAAMRVGDEFVIRPTADGAAQFTVKIRDINKIAVAAPIRTAATTSNTGTGQISVGSVAAGYTNTLPAMTLTYSSATGTLSGFPAAAGPVTVTLANGSAAPGSPFAAGGPVTYSDGATITFGGISVSISGSPANSDTFTIGPNTNGTGDGRNAVALGNLQAAKTLANGSASYQGAYAQLVSLVGNKTREVDVISKAEARYLEQAEAAHQAESGVNLDEEATNLLRYQQAYQAAGKVMQTASQLFELLLTLGGN